MQKIEHVTDAGIHTHIRGRNKVITATSSVVEARKYYLYRASWRSVSSVNVLSPVLIAEHSGTASLR